MLDSPANDKDISNMLYGDIYKAAGMKDCIILGGVYIVDQCRKQDVLKIRIILHVENLIWMPLSHSCYGCTRNGCIC